MVAHHRVYLVADFGAVFYCINQIWGECHLFAVLFGGTGSDSRYSGNSGLQFCTGHVSPYQFSWLHDRCFIDFGIIILVFYAAGELDNFGRDGLLDPEIAATFSISGNITGKLLSNLN